jgi:hypothetical protein
MGVGVVRRESSVGVPLRWLFRYEWMDVTEFLVTLLMLLIIVSTRLPDAPSHLSSKSTCR